MRRGGGLISRGLGRAFVAAEVPVNKAGRTAKLRKVFSTMSLSSRKGTVRHTPPRLHDAPKKSALENVFDHPQLTDKPPETPPRVRVLGTQSGLQDPGIKESQQDTPSPGWLARLRPKRSGEMP